MSNMAANIIKQPKSEFIESTGSLDALEAFKGWETNGAAKSNRLEMLSVDDIIDYRSDDPFRKYIGTDKYDRLVLSISMNGVTDPINVREIEISDSAGGTAKKYELGAGYHRWQACKDLHILRIPSHILSTEEGAPIDDNTFARIHIESNFGSREDIMLLSEKIKALYLYEQLIERKQGFRSDLQGDRERWDRYKEIGKIFKIKNPKEVMSLIQGVQIPGDVMNMVDANRVKYRVVYDIFRTTEDMELRDAAFRYIANGGRMTIMQYKNLKKRRESENIEVNCNNIGNLISDAKEKQTFVFKIDKGFIPEGYSELEVKAILAETIRKLPEKETGKQSAS